MTIRSTQGFKMAAVLASLARRRIVPPRRYELRCDPDVNQQFLFSVTDAPAPRYGFRSMRVDEETTFSMRVAWQPMDPRNVRHYRLSYVSANGDRAEEQVGDAAC